ncbi:WhiB family transcriptional regulator [Promicromonospora sp. Marseille-Q5078]
MQPDTAALPSIEGEAAVSFARQFPIGTARCATADVEGEWVPERETIIVPDEMTALCQRCPGRQDCLLWALAGDEDGYWAATTSEDRKQMRSIGRDDVDTADWLQKIQREKSIAKHAPGEGSSNNYRRKGCRCHECRAANSAERTAERARARARATAAAA